MIPPKAWPEVAVAAVGRPLGMRLQRWGTRLAQPVSASLHRQAWIAEQLRFFHAWRANPKHIGAVLPSSPALAAAITREIDAQTGQVIELGSGTGVFTRALCANGVAEDALALIELDAGFARQLRHDFPQAHVCCQDAASLRDEPLFYGQGAGAVVCGLPLLNMPLRQQVGILRGGFAQLRAGGAFYLFTYGLRCPVPRRVLDRLGLRARKIESVMLNVPPAHVWKLTRRRTARNAL